MTVVDGGGGGDQRGATGAGISKTLGLCQALSSPRPLIHGDCGAAKKC